MKCHLKLHIDIDIDMVDWPIAIKKQIPSRTRSDQLLQRLIYAIRYSQLLITFSVFDVCVYVFLLCVFVCMWTYFSLWLPKLINAVLTRF